MKQMNEKYLKPHTKWMDFTEGQSEMELMMSMDVNDNDNDDKVDDLDDLLAKPYYTGWDYEEFEE